MYDAWAAYDDIAVATTDLAGARRRPEAERTEGNKKAAISFAAFRCLSNLYPSAASLARLTERLDRATDMRSTTRRISMTTPAGVGNVAAQAVIDARRNDGSNQYGDLPSVPCVPFTDTLHATGRRSSGASALALSWPGRRSDGARMPTTMTSTTAITTTCHRTRSWATARRCSARARMARLLRSVHRSRAALAERRGPEPVAAARLQQPLAADVRRRPFRPRDPVRADLGRPVRQSS